MDDRRWDERETLRRMSPAEKLSVMTSLIRIVKKLEYYAISDSDRHLRDISMMLDISGENVGPLKPRGAALSGTHNRVGAIMCVENQPLSFFEFFLGFMGSSRRASDV